MSFLGMRWSSSNSALALVSRFYQRIPPSIPGAAAHGQNKSADEQDKRRPGDRRESLIISMETQRGREIA
jgi:hypothetical protein